MKQMWCLISVTDIVFLVYSKDTRESTEPTDDKLFCIPLEQLIRLSQPPNFESIQNLLPGNAKHQLWSKTTSIISRLIPWMGFSNSPTSKYKAFEFNELGCDKYALHSVCSKDSRLRTISTCGFTRTGVWKG